MLGPVLVVEDDAFVAELAAGMLNELGFEAIVAHSAKEALERLTAGDRPKLIFSDIVMPGGISGLELACKVRDRFPELPILLTTGYSEQVAGTHGFPVLHKPYEMDSLAGAVRKILKDNVTAR
jgi:CheY-like chemotaxis protein